MKTFIIAEAGVNHNGDIKNAKRLISVAVEAGADAVKFQTFRANKIVTVSTPKANYQIENTGTYESQAEMLRKLEFSPDVHEELISYCIKKGIIFMSTPFDEESVDMLDRLGIEIFKIPSGEITNKPLVQYIASKKRPIILSTGMSFIGEVEKAIGWINEECLKTKESIFQPDISQSISPLTLLHCVSDYPAAFEDINLQSMKTMEQVFELPVGYSDHTMGIEIPVAAVAMGAKVIEKHFTLDRNMKGPDHKASLEPDELKTMVTAIRNVEKAMGDGIKKPTKTEIDTRDVIRRSLVTVKDIKAGKRLVVDDIAIKRPGAGIPPEFKEVIIGLKVNRDIMGDSIIRWEDINNA